tara:strand:- start:653 stop:973 length:321 start_codon:yes stop_codon:yes gene_type:complete
MELLMYWILGLDTSLGCPWKIPVSATPWFRAPAGLTSVTGALVASGSGVGLATASPAVVGTGVGSAAVFAVGVMEVEDVSAPGVAVADDPQANSRATNSSTIALGI